jgi:hypothetical protein
MRSQRMLLAEARAAFNAVNERAREATAGLGDAQWSWCPPDGGWSVGQVLEHLIVTNEQFLGKITWISVARVQPRRCPA